MYWSNFLLDSSLSRFAFWILMLRASTSLDRLSSNSARVFFCCAWSFYNFAFKLADNSAISLACLDCSSLRLCSRISIFFWRESILMLRTFSWSPEWSACLSNFSLSSSLMVSSSLFLFSSVEICWYVSSLKASLFLFSVSLSLMHSLSSLLVESSLSINSSMVLLCSLDWRLFSALTLSSSFCLELS